MGHSRAIVAAGQTRWASAQRQSTGDPQRDLPCAAQRLPVAPVAPRRRPLVHGVCLCSPLVPRRRLGAHSRRLARAGAAGGRAPAHPQRRHHRASSPSGRPSAAAHMATTGPRSCRGANAICSWTRSAWCTACGWIRPMCRTARGLASSSQRCGLPCPPGADLSRQRLPRAAADLGLGDLGLARADH
jgi:hypothetical protein